MFYVCQLVFFTYVSFLLFVLLLILLPLLLYVSLTLSHVRVLCF